MSYHKVKSEFKIGDLIQLDEYNVIFSPQSNKSKQIAIVVSGPNYGRSMTYQDWEVVDEPLYDIMCNGRMHNNVPQRFMEKVIKK